MSALPSTQSALTRPFENGDAWIILATKEQFIAKVEIAAGQSFEVSEQQGREETMTIIKGDGVLEFGDVSQEISPICLVKLVANKVCRIFNNTQEKIQLCFVSSPSDNPNDEIYIRSKDKCYEIKTGKNERIRELWGIYGNGPSRSHSIALVEIDEGGWSTPHVHPFVKESYAMLDGTAKLVVGDKILFPKVWEAEVIPVGERHEITNNGKGVLRFIAVVTPPWTQDCGIYETSK